MVDIWKHHYKFPSSLGVLAKCRQIQQNILRSYVFCDVHATSTDIDLNGPVGLVGAQCGSTRFFIFWRPMRICVYEEIHFKFPLFHKAYTFQLRKLGYGKYASKHLGQDRKTIGRASKMTGS